LAERTASEALEPRRRKPGRWELTIHERVVRSYDVHVCVIVMFCETVIPDTGVSVAPTAGKESSSWTQSPRAAAAAAGAAAVAVAVAGVVTVVVVVAVAVVVVVVVIVVGAAAAAAGGVPTRPSRRRRPSLIFVVGRLLHV